MLKRMTSGTDWDDVWADLEATFRHIQGRVRSKLPDIGWQISRGPGVSSSRVFDAYLSFAHLPLEAPVEDVLLQFACAPAGTGGFWAEDGMALFPETPERHALRFEIMLGTGQTLAKLTPVLLPAQVGSPEYQQLVRSFLSDSAHLAETNVALVVDTLVRRKNPPTEDTKPGA